MSSLTRKLPGRLPLTAALPTPLFNSTPPIPPHTPPPHPCPSEGGSLSVGSKVLAPAPIQSQRKSHFSSRCAVEAHPCFLNAPPHTVKTTFGLKSVSPLTINSLSFALKCLNYQHIKRQQEKGKAAG